MTVLGVAGPITLDRGEVKIAADGTISQGGTVKGKLLTALDPKSVATAGQQPVTGTPAGTPTARVRQNHLESSTVNVVSEMVELIRVMRSFEANQKSVHAQDEALLASVTKVGVGRLAGDSRERAEPSRTALTWRSSGGPTDRRPPALRSHARDDSPPDRRRHARRPELSRP